MHNIAYLCSSGNFNLIMRRNELLNERMNEGLRINKMNVVIH